MQLSPRAFDLSPSARRRLALLSPESGGSFSLPLRLRPLVIRDEIKRLVQRRKGIWTESVISEEDYGLRVRFRHLVRGSAAHPQGRAVSGEFDVTLLSPQACVLASRLNADEDKYGPHSLAQRAYPLGVRPFLRSDQLKRAIDDLGSTRSWDAVSVDVVGFDKETGSFRRDTKNQSLDEAMREMVEQGRQPHRVRLSFRDEEGTEQLRVALDRNAGVALFSGSALVPVAGFVAPAIERCLREDEMYAIPFAESPRSQQALRVVFQEDAFPDIDATREVCNRLRRVRGFAVNVVHANPYLQAQVVDFLCGTTVTLLVLDTSTVTLLPRSPDCSLTMRRVVAALFREIGEGLVSVAGAEASSGETALP